MLDAWTFEVTRKRAKGVLRGLMGGQCRRERVLVLDGVKEGQAAEMDVSVHKLAQGFVLTRGGELSAGQ